MCLGALVAVECNDTNSKPSFRKEVQTNKHGEFKVHLPFSFSKHVEKIQGCSLKLISSGELYCSVASTTTSNSLHLKSRKPGTQIFSAGFFTFKPLTQPNICNQNPSVHNSKKLISVKSHNTDPAFAASFQVPPPPILHHIDNLAQFTPIPVMPRLPPLPQFPPLPGLPGLPFPNPLQPQPAIIPPLIPWPPSSIFHPSFPLPHPRSFFPLIPPYPPILGFTPPPSPPPPAELLPAFPFQPSPGFPGIKPVALSSLSTKKNP